MLECCRTTDNYNNNIGECLIKVLVVICLNAAELLIFTTTKFHSLKRVPPQMWEMASYVNIGKTVEQFEQGSNRKRIPNYENIRKAWKRVCAHKSEYYSETVGTYV
ncbi:MAG TPA: hypothetical protein VF273_07405 [Pelobium sp.]